MKKILIKSVLLISITSLLMILLSFIENSIINKKVNIEINSEIKYGIFGHSHSETAFNDSLISNFKNFSSSGESYFYTYFKLRKLLEEENSLEAVFVEFTNNQINLLRNDWIWGDMFLDDKYLKYEPFIEFDEQLFLFGKNPQKVTSIFLTSKKKSLYKILEGNYDYFDLNRPKFGGYTYLNNELSEVEVLNAKNLKLNNRDHSLISIENLRYLNKIVLLCLDKGVKLFFVRSPQHKYFVDRNNEKLFQKTLYEHYPQVDFLDFNNFGLLDQQFADLGHLNYKGASKFSLWFDNLINSTTFLNSDSKQDFINKEMNEFQSKKNKMEAIYLSNKIDREENELLNKIISNAVSVELNHPLLSQISIIKMWLFSKQNYLYVLLELDELSDKKNLENLAFGVHGTILKEDFEERPKWLIDQNSDRLTWNCNPQVISLNNKEYVLLSLEKQYPIEKFEKMRFFLKDKDQFNGVIGKALEVSGVNFQKKQ